jgi:hypothetical protein
LSGVSLSDEEQEQLYILLKPLEIRLGVPLAAVLGRIEKSLFARLTVGELEALASRFGPDR